MMLRWNTNAFFQPLRPRQNGRRFPDDIFTWIFVNENIWILIKISLKFVPKGLINYIASLVQIMAWRRPSDKPLSEPMMVNLLTHTCVTRPQWVKKETNHLYIQVLLFQQCSLWPKPLCISVPQLLDVWGGNDMDLNEITVSKTSSEHYTKLWILIDGRSQGYVYGKESTWVHGENRTLFKTSKWGTWK